MTYHFLVSFKVIKIDSLCTRTEFAFTVRDESQNGQRSWKKGMLEAGTQLELPVTKRRSPENNHKAVDLWYHSKCPQSTSQLAFRRGSGCHGGLLSSLSVRRYHAFAA